MRNRRFRLIMAALMIGLLLSCAALAAADADPIRVSSLSEPQSVISEQEVNITIKIYNSSQTDMEEEIILYNPGGISVAKYAGLKAESSVTYTGTWSVTQEQIDAGKIKYYIKYTVTTENGKQETNHTIPVTIQAETAAPQLTATYSVSPAAAREGQTVTLSYTLANTGNIELRNISIANEGVTKEKVTRASLSVGEKVTVTDTFTMGSKELVSQPKITYQAAGSDKTLTISDLAKKTITVAEDGLDVTIKAENTKGVYPGEAVEFTLDMKNSGNTGYSGLTVTDDAGQTVATGVELAPGASYSGTFTRTFTADTAVSVTVSGTDGSGESVTVVSSEVPVTTQDASRALILEVSAQAGADVIYSEPAVVRFAVTVKNTGETDATNLTVKQGDTTVAKIASLPSGESRTLVFDLETSIAGQFRFDVAGKDADGLEKTYSSGVLKVSYVEPTPAPTATPAPTPVPPTPTPVPTATPVPTLAEIISSHVNPVVLYVTAGVLGALLALILIASAVQSGRRRKRLAGAIDTIELSPDTRNHRGVKRKKGKPEQKKETLAQQEPIVPTPELESEPENPDSTTPARDALRRAEREESRRRRAAQPQPVSTEETLRVAPVDQRPEFVAQGKVDDSQTLIFGKLTENVPAAPEAPKEDTPEAPKAEKPDDKADETIRLDRAAIDAELKRQTAQADAAHTGKTRSELTPMKKKKRGLFGRKHSDDDLFENEETFSDEDDDFIS